MLILAPYLSRMPLFSVTVPRSLPARSMSESLPQRRLTSVLLVRSRRVTMTWKMACERDECWFAFVASVVRLRLPYESRFITSFLSKTRSSVTPAIVTPLIGSSLRSKYVSFECGTSRSRMISLYIST